MCGRYTTDIETDEEELFQVLRRADVNTPEAAAYLGVSAREVFPTDPAAVIFGRDPSRLAAGGARYGIRYFRWGYPMEKRTLINARSESAEEKAIFSASLPMRRCVIPTAGFFEWSHTGERIKYRFNLPDSGILYLAGLYRPMAVPDARFSDVRQEFVILTTEANASMADIHSRMPLILLPEALDSWIYDTSSAMRILHSAPPELVRKAV